MIALEQDLDDTWRAERNYVIADMNGSAVFLFAALKMKLKLAVGRRLAPFEPALDALLSAMDLRDDLRDAARAVSPRRDRPADARRLLDHFEAVGAGAATRRASWSPSTPAPRSLPPPASRPAAAATSTVPSR
jgi:hypothetical protein